MSSLGMRQRLQEGGQGAAQHPPLPWLQEEGEGEEEGQQGHCMRLRLQQQQPRSPQPLQEH